MEIWKDIVGFESKYQISNLGNVKSLERYDGIGRKIKGRVLKRKHDGGGYPCVCLVKNGVHHYKKIHRLVAEAFIPNPNNKPTVNHIDENKENNTVENLEWATYMENAHHGTRIERCYSNRDYKEIGRKTSETHKKNGYCRKIKQYDLNGNLLNSWESIKDAATACGISPSGIGNAVRHYKGCKRYKGFVWEYA